MQGGRYVGRIPVIALKYFNHWCLAITNGQVLSITEVSDSGDSVLFIELPRHRKLACKPPILKVSCTGFRKRATGCYFCHRSHMHLRKLPLSASESLFGGRGGAIRKTYMSPLVILGYS